MSEARGTVLRLDVGGQLGLELKHGAALLRLTLEVSQVLQGLVGVHPLEVASVNRYTNQKSAEKTAFKCMCQPPQLHHQILN